MNKKQSLTTYKRRYCFLFYCLIPSTFQAKNTTKIILIRKTVHNNYIGGYLWMGGYL